ncbi:Mitochondrial carrier [Madurella fahalii]|uniref:Mitochondrial carrier n=1 Tax=Madurella fahalii TaxID=1157608 RepID=A0ABQ0GLJ1_9PEZI
MRENSHTEILAAGAVAAFTVDLLVYPLDTIKTRYQNRQLAIGWAALKEVKGLYQGVGSVVFATLPAAAIFFASYESSKSILAHSLPTAIPQPAIHALASAGAELASCLVLTPAEVIKQNAQVMRQSEASRRGQSSSLLALRMLQRSEGGLTRRLWTGYTALAARNLPFTAMQFPMFEVFRGYLWECRRHRIPGTSSLPILGSPDKRGLQQRRERLQSLLVETGLITGGAAAASGALAATITTPADVVKTSIMLGTGGSLDTLTDRSTHAPRAVRRRGLDVGRTILRESGIRGLFRGATLRAAWAALGSGLYLGSYEVTKIWLKHRLN